MTSAAPQLILVKQLKEHLQEEQEPFNLSTYLSERRYTLKKSISDGGSTCSILNSTKNQRLYGNKKRHLYNQRSLKSMLYKLFAPDTERQEFSTCHKDVKDQLITETIDMIQQIAETNWFSTVSKGSEFSASTDSSAPQNSPSSEHDKELVIAGTLQALNLRHFEEQKIQTNNTGKYRSRATKPHDCTRRCNTPHRLFNFEHFDPSESQNHTLRFSMVTNKG